MKFLILKNVKSSDVVDKSDFKLNQNLFIVNINDVKKFIYNHEGVLDKNDIIQKIRFIKNNGGCFLHKINYESDLILIKDYIFEKKFNDFYIYDEIVKPIINSRKDKLNRILK